MADSWKQVALALAARLAYARGGCESHAVPADGCPFCADTEAYRRFEARLALDGERMIDPLAGAVAIPLKEIVESPLKPKTVRQAYERKIVTARKDVDRKAASLAKPHLWGKRDGTLWHLDQGGSYSGLSWCGVKEQYRHATFRQIVGREPTLEDVSCSRCKTAIKQDRPRAWGR